MKLFRVSILLFLIIKTSVISGFAMNFDSCSQDQEINISEVSDHCDSEDDDKGCCETSSCDCLCCGHVFIDQVFNIDVNDHQELMLNHDFHYWSSYSHQNFDPIWHPPKMI